LSKWPVLLAVRSLDHGGCERDAAKLAVGLDRNRFEPHVVVLIGGGFRTAEVEAAQVPIVNLEVNSFLNSSALKAAQKLSAYIRKHHIQIVHSLDVPTNIFVTPVARWCRIPVLITSQLSFRDMYTLGSRAALHMTDWLSDSVVVNSRAVGQSLEGEPGLHSKKIFLSYNGVNPAHFHPGPGVRIPALDGSSLVIGSVCVMREEKRMDWVIRSFAQVREHYQGLQLLLVGSGPEVPKLMELRDSLGLHDFCHFEPGQPDVAPWMRSMDIYINSSSSESFPNGLLEAMASGCCVIGANVGGIPELVTHLADGLVFDSDKPDSLTKMLKLAVTDGTLRNKLRLEAVKTAHDRFSMQIALERMESLYEGLLHKRRIREPVVAC
jgi:glycosyltransferase involved in cell wall biosynthesis